MNGEWTVLNVHITVFERVSLVLCCVVGELVREGVGKVSIHYGNDRYVRENLMEPK